MADKIFDEGLGFDLENRRGEKIHEATLMGSEWDGVDFRESSLLHVNFSGSKLNHINFSQVQVDGIQIGGTTFENIVRPDQAAEGARFKHADLTLTTFENCNLENVNIINSKLDGLRIDGILVTDLLKSYQKGGK